MARKTTATVVASQRGRKTLRAVMWAPRRSEAPPGPHQAVNSAVRPAAAKPTADKGCQVRLLAVAVMPVMMPPTTAPITTGRIRQTRVTSPAVTSCTGDEATATTPSERPARPRTWRRRINAVLPRSTVRAMTKHTAAARAPSTGKSAMSPVRPSIAPTITAVRRPVAGARCGSTACCRGATSFDGALYGATSRGGAWYGATGCWYPGAAATGAGLYVAGCVIGGVPIGPAIGAVPVPPIVGAAAAALVALRVAAASRTLLARGEKAESGGMTGGTSPATSAGVGPVSTGCSAVGGSVGITRVIWRVGGCI